MVSDWTPVKRDQKLGQVTLSRDYLIQFSIKPKGKVTDWGNIFEITSVADTLWCKCKTPGAGTAGYNGFDCTDSTTSYCASSEECYPKDYFVRGNSPEYCRVPGAKNV